MQLFGKVTFDRPLLVLAAAEEAQFLDTSLPVLVTGMGKVNAANALATVLGRGPLPERVVNLGTAGALKPGLCGIQKVDEVRQHDFSTELLHTLTGQTFGGPIPLGQTGGLTLATGDSFITDSVARTRLAQRADLVDMEGYAFAVGALSAGVPIDIVKYVSDEADEDAVKSWRESVVIAAQALAEWAASNVLEYGRRV